MHDLDLDHEHLELTEEQRLAIAKSIWEQENVELTTVGIDIGSSTSHLLFARIIMQRQTQGLSSRFVVIDRRIVWRSPIMLTPFLPDGTIDAGKLGEFIADAYKQAGIKQEEVDSGAVILTGEAIKKTNARAIDEIFAAEAGKFVCATAGHKLECLLAAHGSGAVALSKQRDTCILHVDVGGGTTKLALIDKGQIIALQAFAVGGRLIAQDTTGAWTRFDDSVQAVAREQGLPRDPASLADEGLRRKYALRLAQVAADYILGAPKDALGKELGLTEPLPDSPKPQAFTFSGGVAEYLFTYEEREYGDIAKLLAQELTGQLKARGSATIIDPGQRIRATVIGASQFTVQVSGKTIYLPDVSVLPVHNIPVVRPKFSLEGDINEAAFTKAILEAVSNMDMEPSQRLALAFTWEGDPEYSRLAATARAIKAALGPGDTRDELLVLMIDGDVAKNMGRLLKEEMGLPGNLVSIDGVQLQELDFVDVGELIQPPGVVPVVIKSLLFS
ncbi:MAG: ethanolamine ammonia-lyase reactivating factor EutA [Beijerinckiaceae bacterium]|nr:ethanolamine ammonia-lyase reactivating factor EutA [Beijerinckiaceae bacterium]